MMSPGTKRTFSGTDELRSDRRFKIDLPVLVNTVVADQQGWIVDMSRRGLRLQGITAVPRSRIAIHYRGRFVEGTVRWSTPHLGIGVALDHPLTEGPLGALCQRFLENVSAFGASGRPIKPTFGRKLES